MNPGPIVNSSAGLVQKTVDTWESFERELTFLRENTSGQLLFRGQEESSWPLTTTLERNKQPRMIFHARQLHYSTRSAAKSVCDES